MKLCEVLFDCAQESTVEKQVWKFTQSCKLLLGTLSKAQLVWLSLENVWPEYGKLFWPAVDVTFVQEGLDAVERLVVHYETDAKRKEGYSLDDLRVVVLVFWNEVEQQSNVVVVTKDDLRSFAKEPALMRHKRNRASKFWSLKTCEQPYSLWFDLAVKAFATRIAEKWTTFAPTQKQRRPCLEHGDLFVVRERQMVCNWIGCTVVAQRKDRYCFKHMVQIALREVDKRSKRPR